jgi:hypothetical protein
MRLPWDRGSSSRRRERAHSSHRAPGTTDDRGPSNVMKQDSREPSQRGGAGGGPALNRVESAGRAGDGSRTTRDAARKPMTTDARRLHRRHARPVRAIVRPD